jgi:hypothetical protein
MSRTHAALLVGITLVAVALACHVDKLVDAPPTGALRASPSSVSVTAAAGSIAIHEVPLAITVSNASPIGWTVTRRGTGSWLSIADSTGGTPGTLRLILTSVRLAAGRYTDTLVLTPDDPDHATTRIPVTLVLDECDAENYDAGGTLEASLDEDDCSGRYLPDRPARRYRITGGLGDSLTFRLSSASVPVALFIDTGSSGGGAPLARSERCGDATCLRYFWLEGGGTYYLEVTSEGSGTGTGPFSLTSSAPHPPTEPATLVQTRRDSTTVISLGGQAPNTDIVVRATVGDPDIADTLRLEVEFQRVGTGFTGAPTFRSNPTPAGAVAYTRVTGLADGASYHWRSRVVDQTGRATEWRSFGGNAESATDLKVAKTPSKVAFRVAPGPTVAGSVIAPPVEVVAVDEAGVLVSSFEGTITLALGNAPSGATLSGDRTVPAVGGIAPFPDLSIERAGSGYTLVASAEALDRDTSAPFAVIPGPMARLAFSQAPTSTYEHAPIAPPVAVMAYDSYDNIATTFAGEMTVAIGRDGSPHKDAKLSGTRTRTAVAGIARFTDLEIDKAGDDYTLKVSAGPFTVTSAAFDIRKSPKKVLPDPPQ